MVARCRAPLSCSPGCSTRSGAGGTRCSGYSPRLFEALARLRRATILAGLDPTPELLVKTPHSYAGSGHHRDPQAIRRVIISFLGQPEVAHRIMAERGIGYVLVDPDGNEATIYGKAAPHGLMADLLADMAPAWLKPVALPGSSLRLWKRVA